MRLSAEVGWSAGGGELRHAGGGELRHAGTVGLGRVAACAAALVLAGMMVPRVAAAAAASGAPVRAAGAGGGGDGIAAREEEAGLGGETVAVTRLRERVAKQGYLLREVRWDPVLRQSWAVLESAGYPERPRVSVLVPLGAKDHVAGATVGRSGGAAAGTSAAAGTYAAAGLSGAAGLYAGANQYAGQPVVHVGDQVTLWSEQSNLHVQLTAVADQSGAVGERVRLHMLGVSMGWEQTPQRLTGTVRGAGSVEMTQ